MSGIDTIGGEPVRAVIFDMDGVVTDTATAHFMAWKAVFDQLLSERCGADSAPFTREDYLRHVDGIPRRAGIRAFLASRDILLPEGEAGDEGTGTVQGIAALKNRRFQSWLDDHEVPVFDDTLALIEAFGRCGVGTGVFSASRNADRVLESAGVSGRFGARVGGTVAAELGLAPKPDPAQLVETARRLGAAPGETIVVEDAASGASAAARGRFGTVVGVVRQGGAEQHDALRAAGADLVTSDLRGLLHNGAPRTLATLPSAWDRRFELEAKAKDRPIAVFLDYDGTLTPIVEDHRAANLSEEMRSALVRLSERHSVAVVSGRDLTDVRGRVDLRNLFYAGSHGFDIAGPGGIAERPSQAERLLGLIDDVEAELRAAIGEVAGAEAERKRFSVAVHYRRVAEADVAALEAAVERVADRHAELGKSRGKKVIEIQPRVAWDKGRAVGWLLDHTPLGAGDPLVLYLGDDLTDEDAFDALGDRGFGIALRGGARLTLADWALEDIDDVGSFLDWLADLATGARA